jgi:hypothetical protein
MRSQLYQEEGLCSEQERLRSEISELTQELHQKEVTIATVMKKAALLERQLKIELEIKERMLAKQQVCMLEGEPLQAGLLLLLILALTPLRQKPWRLVS